MTPRRTILKELDRQRQNGGDYTRPGAIDGFDRQPAKYQAAVNALLQERLINGRKDGDGRLAIAINDDRLADVEKELRHVLARPVTWIAIVAVIALAVTGYFLL